MSVIGIDFGNEACYLAVARAGGIETIANDYSLRSTPAFVAFTDKTRILGVAAKNQMVTNLQNTIYGFKKLLGRRLKDPMVQNELKHLPYRAVEGPNGSIRLKVGYLGEEQSFSPEQIAAMLFTKLKETCEVAMKIKVNDCVISVPSYFTDAERRALLDAATIAGFNCLRLMNETTATALAYGIYKQDLPGIEEKPRNVVIVDMGQSSTQACAVAYNKGKLKVLASVFDPMLGGRDFDHALALHFNEEFRSKFKVDALKKPRAFIRLLQEVEKLKKQMSANSTILPLAIECFIDEKDVSGKMKRTDMESLCTNLVNRAEHLFRKLLTDSKLKPDDIYSVEVVGGSTRIPAIKNLVQRIFGKEASTTLNQDEAVARGCALQCAMLSPSFKVREFVVSDAQLFPIKLLWKADMGEEGEMEVFPQFHPIPFSKMLTFYRKENFMLEAYYIGSIPHPDPFIGQFQITKVVPTPEGESAKVKVKVRLNIHGVFGVSSATLVEKKETVEEEEMEVDQNKDNGDNAGIKPNADGNAETLSDANTSNDMGTEPPKGNKVDAEIGDKKTDQPAKKAKHVIKQIELPIEARVAQLSRVELDSYIEQECKMIAADRQEKERVDAKNALEEYIYDIRARLSDELAAFISDTDRDSFALALEDTENWLYDEGEDLSKQVYFEKLTELRKYGEPVKERRREFEERPHAIDELGHALQLTRKAIDMYKNQDERYSHITPEEMDKLAKAAAEKQDWLDKQLNVLSRSSMHQNPPILAAQIRKEKELFDSVVGPILNKPKAPKPVPPKENPAPNAEANDKGAQQAPTNVKEEKDKMDLD